MSMPEIAGYVNNLFPHVKMVPPAMRLTITLLLAVLLVGSFFSYADDGAASIAAGGIVMKREPRITMQKELLKLSSTKVSVDYEFRNDSDADITTEVAFPVPPYKLDWDERPLTQQGFDDFRLTVDQKPTNFRVEVKAKLKGRDVSTALRKDGIDIATFGHFNEDSHYAKDIRKLSSVQRASLVQAGLIDPETDQDEGRWSVEKKYYWQQTFPARSIIHISHEYAPVLGSTNSVRYGLEGEDAQSTKELESLCLDPILKKSLSTLASDSNNSVPFSYVDFILTTANTWKTPIEDFTLIIERPHVKDASQNFISFCWDGPVTRIDADHFATHISNLIAKKELRVGFISVYKSR